MKSLFRLDKLFLILQDLRDNASIDSKQCPSACIAFESA